MYQSIQSVKKSAPSLVKNQFSESELSPDSHPKRGSRFSICDHRFVLVAWLADAEAGQDKDGRAKIGRPSTTIDDDAMALGMDPGSHVLRSQAACYMVLSQYGIVKKIWFLGRCNLLFVTDARVVPFMY
jgi:hypothetical protein